VSSHWVQSANRVGRATRAEVSALARERKQVLVRAGIAADAREAVLEHPTGEELVGNLPDDGPPRAVLAREAVVVDHLQAVQVIGHQPKERRRLGSSGFIDAARRTRWIGHRHSLSRERRAYVRLRCVPSPFRCATGCFDAPSTWFGPHDACCCRADPPFAQRSTSRGPLAAETSVEAVE